MAKRKKRTYKTKRQRLIETFIKHMVSGGAFFWSGYILFAILYGGLETSLVTAKVASYVFGLTVNFIIERLWVFRVRNPDREITLVTGRYIILSAVNLCIDVLIVAGLNNIGISPYIGQFISSGFFTVWNYLWYKLWVFKLTPLRQRRKARRAQRRRARGR